MKIEEIKQTSTSVRIKGDNFRYLIKKVHSISSGCTFLMIDLPDVNGEPILCDIFSTETGSFE